MKRLYLLLCLLIQATTMMSQSEFKVADGTFLLDGEPFVVRAAELHYPRIPQPYWEHRITQCKALGMNTVCLYVFWNIHEQQPDEFDFTGNNDLAEFIRLCGKHDMKVILRPGPYVCAEWEMGGLPWWLLQKTDIRLRENDTYFLERVEKFQQAVAEQVSSLTTRTGGPIIMVQVENEYGSYGIDKEYVANIRDIVRRHFPGVTLFQCDWSSNFTNNALDDLIWTMNFGTGADIDQQFATLKELRPDSPLMCSEFWSGWFDKWGANHETRPADDMVAGIDEMLSKGISFSLYMTHGGTNWGHWAGANSPGYAPDVTSYDYDAPINEAGQTTEKYWLLRNTLAKYAGKLPSVPKNIPVTKIERFQLSEVAPLWSNLPPPATDADIHSMEHYGQGFGSILYSTTLPRLPGESVLTVNDAHDYAQVFIDGQKIGVLDRRGGDKQLLLPPTAEGQRLDILVEAMGRINFGRAIKDFKGITESVTLTVDLDGYPFVCDLKNWQVCNIEDDLNFYKAMTFEPLDGRKGVAGVYRGTFTVKKPADTFLDFSTWGKGLVYVNGHALGRFWNIGPQQTLYMPGCWLKKGDNEIVVLDITGPEDTAVEGLVEPIIDHLAVARPLTHRTGGQALDLSDETPFFEGTFKSGNGWQELPFGTIVTGRYICLEALDSHDGGDIASIAELYLLDADGERLSREPWVTLYADSEDVAHSNHSADKLFDLQESTSWTTIAGDAFPHAVVIDLGATRSLSAIQYLPRMEDGAPGSVKRFRLFVSNKEFSLSVLPDL